MIYQRLRIFVSSKMEELAPERRAVKAALDALKVDAWVFEQDAGARPESIQKAFLDEIQVADLYLGLFWKGYGDYTIEEYEHARKLGKDCLIYEKHADLNGQRDARLQAFLDQLGDVKTGLTIKWFNTPAELSEVVEDDIAKWQARKIRERQTPRISLNLSLAEKKDRDELLILLAKVKQFWVRGVLEKSVHGQALIDLGKEVWTETTEHPWERILELPDETSRTLPKGERIGKLFEELGRSLVILGAPGSGKTITSLDLTRELIARAEDDPAQPIPVVFNLSSWTDPRRNLLDWLIDELLAKYQIPKKIGRRWLEENWLLPLLDGLDEVTPSHQAACVDAINTYVKEHGAPGLVVCSRLKDYTTLPVRLHLSAAICLQPLKPEQVKEYVAGSGEPLAGLYAALEKDRVLQTLAETPLMLDVMSLAYRDLPAAELASEALATEEERRSHLFDTYIGKMFIRKGKGTQVYGREQTIGWLSWLAKGMQQHGQTLFLIEQLQPSWLETRAQYMAFALSSRLLVGLIGGLIAGLIGGLFFGPITGLIAGLTAGLSKGLVVGLMDTSGLFHCHDIRELVAWAKNKDTGRPLTMISWSYFLSLGLGIGQMLWLIADTKFALVVYAFSFESIFWMILGGALYFHSLDRNLTNEIQCVETLRWSWVNTQKTALVGLIGGLIAGLIPGLIAGLIGGLEIGVIVWLVVVLASGLINAFFGGLTRSIIDSKAVPNAGILLSIQNAMIASGVGLLIFGLIFGLAVRLAFGLSNWLFFGVSGGLILGLTAVLWYGSVDVIQHFTLRFILLREGHVPLRYARFLDHATRLIFLQRVGGGYIFIHRLLLEHFAAMTKMETLREI